MKFFVKEYWNIVSEGELLVVSGGADEVYELALDEQQSVFLKLDKRSYDTKQLSQPDLIIHEQLLAAGVVQPATKKQGKILKYAMLGDVFDNMPESSSGEFKMVASRDDADVYVVVRSSQTFDRLLSSLSYATIKKPHIFLDLAYHSIVSIGPLVFPGETACLACLEGRIKQRWGDPEPPPVPRGMQVGSDLAKGILAVELSRFANDDYALVGKTMSLNIDKWECSVKHLYKVVYCPICNTKLNRDTIHS